MKLIVLYVEDEFILEKTEYKMTLAELERKTYDNYRKADCCANCGHCKEFKCYIDKEFPFDVELNYICDSYLLED